MPTAILSDIHGNLEALDEVLRDARAQGAKDFVCLGDVVGYGADPNACCERLIDLGCRTIRGNHDHACAHRVPLTWFNPVAAAAVRWTRKELSPENREWLRDLPYTAGLGADVELVHGGLQDPPHWPYLFEEIDAAEHFPFQRTQLCFTGHTHVPQVFIKTGGRILETPPNDVTVPQGEAMKVAVNVGSVGQPRDRDPRACYCLFDPATRRIEFRRVSYDIRAVAAKILSAGLPPILGFRLFKGA